MKQKIIDLQKVVAANAIEAVEHFARGVPIVAGGAPRNWYFGEKAADIDVFLESNGCNGRIYGELLEVYGTVTMLRPDAYFAAEDIQSDRPYCNEYLEAVLEVLDGETKIQFIIVNEPPLQVMEDYFGCSLSKIYYDGNDSYASMAFIDSIKTGVMEVSLNSGKYASKMVVKYGVDFKVNYNRDY